MTDTKKEINLKNDDITQNLVYNFALVRLEKLFSGTDDFEWIKKDIMYKSHSDICFRYKNKTFSVLIDVQDKKGASMLAEDDKNRQLAVSKENGLVACTFPLIMKKSGVPKPRTDGWNLLETATNSQIDIEKMSDKSFNKISDWVLQCFCIEYIKDYLVKNNNQIVSVQDISKDEPNLWCKTEDGNDFYVILSIFDSKQREIFVSNKKTIVDKYSQKYGYEVVLSVSESKSKSKSSYKSRIEVDIKEYTKIGNNQISKTAEYENIVNENIYELILSSIKQNSISDKTNIKICPVPGYDNLLLKMHGVLVENIDMISKNLKLIPYSFSDKLKNNPHFGLPLYYVTSKTSKFADLKEAEPQNTILFNETNTVILKKVSGQSVMAPYYKSFIKLCYGKNIDIKTGLQKIINIRVNYGPKASSCVIESMDNGIYNIPQNKLAPGSIAYNFEKDKDFYSIYKDFCKNYIIAIKSLAELDQKAYNNAIENIMLSKNFVFDFINPNNTLVDFENNEFNFIDFMYDETLVKSIPKKLQVEYFKRVLLGINDKKPYKPTHLLFRSYDIEQFSYYERIITDKISKAVIKNLS